MKKHIMIVDNDKTNLDTAVGILQEKYELSVANSGEAALAVLNGSIPDLLVLDLQYEDMDGLELMDRMNSHPLWRTIPIIFITAQDNSAMEAACLRKGALDFIHKPYAPDAILARIERTLKMISDRKELERQWQNIHNMVSVEQVLFDAHRKENGIEMAMQLICESESAKRAFIMEKKENGFECVAEWCADGSGRLFEADAMVDNKAYAPWLEQLVNHWPVSIPNVEEIREAHPESYEFLVENGTTGFVAAPIYFSDNTFYGFLEVDNPGANLHSIDMLYFLSLGFSRTYENLEEHKKIERMGKYDFTTGVLNRNSYFNFLHDYSYVEGTSMGCVFIDVNGLHEYNNNYGHKLGDKMLEAIAASLRNRFGAGCTYRVGGDEFIVLAQDVPLEEIQARMEDADREVCEKEYSMSYGIEWRDSGVDVAEMVKIADTRMYEAKSEHYAKLGLERRTVR